MAKQNWATTSLVIGFFLTIVFLGAEKWMVSLFTNDVRMHELLHTIWWIVAGAQAFNALLYILDGILFGARAFGFLRRRVVEGFVFVFLPLFAFGYFVEASLLGLWLSILGLNLYRFFSEALWFWRASLK